MNVSSDLSTVESESPSWIHGALVGLAMASAVVYVATQGSGSFDEVVRHEWAALSWWVVALLVAVGQWPCSKPSGPVLALMGALVLFGTWSMISIDWSASSERTVTEAARVGAYLGVVTALVLCLTPKTWRTASAGTAAGVGVVVLVAFASRLAPETFDAVAVAQTSNARRLSYPIGYWNALGAWAGAALVLSLAWSAHERHLVVRAVALAVAPIAVIVGYLTYSRASLAGVLAGLLVLMALSKNRWTIATHGVATALSGGFLILTVRDYPELAEGTGNTGATSVLVASVVGAGLCGGIGMLSSVLGIDRLRLPRPQAQVIAGMALFGVVVVGAVMLPSQAPDAWDSFKTQSVEADDDPAARLTNLNSGGRYLLWRTAADAFERQPARGIGAGTFEFFQNQQGRSDEFVRDAHSLYLETLAELGVPGLILLLMVIGAVIAVYWHALAGSSAPASRGVLAGGAATLAILMIGAGVDWLWESTAIVVVVLALAACAAAGTAGSAAQLRWPVRGALVAAALGMFALQLPGLVSYSEIRRSQDAVARGDLSGARAHANTAIDVQPWAATPLIQRALVDERDAQLDAARSELRAAQDREPENWRIPLLLARVEARRGNADAAVVAYARAKELRPGGEFFEGG